MDAANGEIQTHNSYIFQNAPLAAHWESVDDSRTTQHAADLSWRIFPLVDVIVSLTSAITAGGC